MITELKSTPPFIHFGFYKTEEQIITGSEVTVWISTLFGESQKTVMLETEIPFREISPYEYVLIPQLPGTYNLQLTVTDTDEKENLTSNTLTLKVT